jgi:transcriptional regulator with XRE-family HTH domain
MTLIKHLVRGLRDPCKDDLQSLRNTARVPTVFRQDRANEAWRQAFADRLERSPLSQADVARLIDRKQQQVSDWLAGRANPPRPAVVFAIEDALGCPDELACHLGYVRVQTFDTEAVIRQDPNLSPEDRDALLTFYRLAR